MRLHRIALTDFRGVTASDVGFEAPGVTVVVGPNEVGKSSLAEALRLIREFKSSSQHSAIRAVQPTNRDVGPEVTIEASSGPFRFTYTKRWLRKPMTELTISAPAAEQLTGDAAHDRVEQIFSATMDDDLWAALQQVQGESLQQARLARIVPLQSALSTLADDGADTGTSHEDLIDRIEQEYRRYFTATGRPTDTYAATIRELGERSEVVAAAEQALRAVDEVVERHERLTAERTRLVERVDLARVDADQLAEREGDLTDLRRQHDEATVRLNQAEIALAAAQAAVEARAERRAEAEERAGLALAATEAWELAVAEHEAAVASVNEFDAAREDVTADLRALRAEVGEADRSVRSVQARIDAEAVRERLAGIDSATARLEVAEAEIADNRVEPDTVSRLADTVARLNADRDAAAAGAARFTVERLGRSVVTIDEDDIDASITRDLTAAATVEVAGVVRVCITPDDQAVRRSRQIEDRAHQVEALLADLGVSDLAEARRRSGEREDAVRRADAARVERETLLAGETVEAVRARLSAASIEPGPAPGQTDLVNARTLLDELATRLAETEAAASDSSHERDRVVAVLNTTNERRLKAETVAGSAADESDRAMLRLAADREVRDDAGLDEALTDCRTQHMSHAAALESARTALRDQDADGLEMLASNARELAKRLVDDLAQRDADLVASTTELEVRGRDGLRNRLDESLAKQANTSRVHDSLHSRATAAQLLRDTMRAHRDSAQQRYVAPFRQAVELLGAIVFGAGFAVGIGDDLSIVSRTIDGATVPFESLSGGAKEQLALIGRLATAQLVSSDDGAPVILDDSLGFTDADRRRRLAAVLNRVGATSQIIILTCEPERFADIGSARTVRLG
ncbi:AAA family ATPase [Aeromicrobium sp.]|uniref:AAA family ATPase n=1 Tax=Aeromicrobium sp. TaxID=1871063 RepID=UPI003C37F134